MMCRVVCRVLVACALGLGLQPSIAEAKGFMLVTYGDSVFHVANVPADRKALVRARPALRTGRADVHRRTADEGNER